MKKSIIILGMLGLSLSYAQQDNNGKVGVNTETPSATLNVKSKTGTTSATKNLELENANSEKLVTVLDNGNVGIGTTTPTTKLELVSNAENTAFRMADGSQGEGKVLTSDENGNATWKTSKETKVTKVVLSNDNISFNYIALSQQGAQGVNQNSTREIAKYKNIEGENEIGIKVTDSSIILPKGQYLIFITHDIWGGEYARLSARKVSNDEMIFNTYYAEALSSYFSLDLAQEDGIYFEVLGFALNPKYPTNGLANPIPSYYLNSYDNLGFSNVLNIMKIK